MEHLGELLAILGAFFVVYALAEFIFLVLRDIFK